MVSQLIQSSGITQAIPVGLVGGKGAQLANLVQHELPVPKWFCVSTQAFAQFIEENGTTELGEPTSPDDRACLRQRLIDAPLPTALQHELEEAIAMLLTDSASDAICVRSSATVEDSVLSSYAGQFDTYLGITDVEEAIRSLKLCWASLWSERALQYQQQSSKQAMMAVVIQEFLPADIAGVMFTTNPITKIEGECVIEASWGVGELMVSGEIMPDHFVVDISQGMDSTFSTLTTKLGTKSEGLFWNKAQKKLERRANLRFFRQRSVLEEQQLIELAKWGIKIQNAMGSPQDIEWALYQDNVYILQTRPITTILEGSDLSAIDMV